MSQNNVHSCSNKERFAVGSKVTSRVTAQGLEAGRTYTVEAVHSLRTFCGTFLTVAVRDGTQVCYVSNPALVLEEGE